MRAAKAQYGTAWASMSPAEKRAAMEDMGLLQSSSSDDDGDGAAAYSSQHCGGGMRRMDALLQRLSRKLAPDVPVGADAAAGESSGSMYASKAHWEAAHAKGEAGTRLATEWYLGYSALTPLFKRVAAAIPRNATARQDGTSGACHGKPRCAVGVHHVVRVLSIGCGLSHVEDELAAERGQAIVPMESTEPLLASMDRARAPTALQRFRTS